MTGTTRIQYNECVGEGVSGSAKGREKTDRQTYKQVDKQTGLPKRDMHKMTNISEKIRSCSHVSKHQVFFLFHRLESRHKTRFVGLSSRHSDIHTQSGISKHGDTVSSYYSCSSPPAVCVLLRGKQSVTHDVLL